MVDLSKFPQGSHAKQKSSHWLEENIFLTSILLCAIQLVTDQRESLTCVVLLPDFVLLSNTIISALFLLLR